MPFYIEAGKAAIHKQSFEPLAAFYTQHMMAVLRSIDGDNRGALADLERMFSLVRAIGSAYPPIFCNYLNSLAIELAEVGRLEEAARACRIILAPSFASAYPEYRETSNDIALRGRRASRSVVAFSQTNFDTENILRLPAPERSRSFSSADSCLDTFHQSARILNYAEWKKKMVKEPNGNRGDEKAPEELTERQLLVRLMEIATADGVTQHKLRRMILALEKIASEPDEKP